MGARITVKIQSARGPVATARAELASTVEERTRGLMGRVGLGPDEGMYFALPSAAAWGFHMANTPTALDLIFVRGGVVLGDARGAPFDPTPFAFPGTYDAVLEVPAGFVRRHDVRPGDVVTLDFGATVGA